MRLRSARSAPRRGVTLLETLVAGAIFFITIVGINTLLETADRQAMAVKQRSLAIQAAQSKLNEIKCGALGFDASSGEIEELPGWEYAIETSETEVTGLRKITVRIKKQDGTSTNDVVVLETMSIDPAKRGSPLDQIQVTTGGETTGGESGGAMGGGAMGGGAMGGGAMGGGAMGGGGMGGMRGGGGAMGGGGMRGGGGAMGGGGGGMRGGGGAGGMRGGGGAGGMRGGGGAMGGR